MCLRGLRRACGYCIPRTAGHLYAADVTGGISGLCTHPAFRQTHVLPASLMLRASSLESNLANFLVPEICLSEQDFTVVVTFPGALSSRGLLHKSK